MHTDYSIIDRIGVSIIVFLSMYGGVRLFTKTQRRRLRTKEIAHAHECGLPTGSPRLLYFWTEECAPCLAQEREINQAKERLKVTGVYLAVNKLNAHTEKLFTKRFNIMTVPTTVLLDAKGIVVGWNPGLTRASRLIDQVAKSIPTPTAKQTV
jgi:hypothetical protein